MLQLIKCCFPLVSGCDQVQANDSIGEAGAMIITFIRAYYRTSSVIGAIWGLSQDSILDNVLRLKDWQAGELAFTRATVLPNSS
jgi:hypothetical protein